MPCGEQRIYQEAPEPGSITQQRQHPTTYTHVCNYASVARYQPCPTAGHDRLPSPLGNVGSQASSRLHPQDTSCL